MAINRRNLLCAAAATAASTSCSSRPTRSARPDATAILYDATRCIGCETCVGACKAEFELPPDRSPDGLHDAPQDLSPSALTVIKHHQNGGEESYVKRQCMHCLDPACVSVCMLGALSKVEHGIVAWDPDTCIGCRYCQLACPFNVPRFEWRAAVPRIAKCEMCRPRQADGKPPACVETCPAGALTFGPYSDIHAEATRRIQRAPDRYIPRVYGETEGGGTQVLYLSALPFALLGLPDLDDEAVPALSETIQHGIYQGFIAPAALYVALGAVLWRHRRKNGSGEVEK